MSRIFISYSRNDETFARKLATSLSEMGADIWIDVEDIPAGMNWSSAIQQGLDSGELMLVIISPTSMGSSNVSDEWQYYHDHKKPIIPVLLHPARIHFQLNRLQYVDFHTQKYDRALSQLHIELMRQGLTLDTPPLDTEEEETVQSVPTTHPPMPVMTSSPTPQSTTGYTPPPAMQQQQSMGRQLNPVWIAGAVAAMAVLIVMGLLLAGGDDNGAEDDTDAPTTEQVAVVATEPAETVTEDVPPTPTDAVIPDTVLINAEWTPDSQTFDEVEMVLVPPGCFDMGSSTSDLQFAVDLCSTVLGSDSCTIFDDETPQTNICFEEPFWIDRYEVTNSAYGSPGTYGGADLPRTNITWEEAQTHCESRGGSLPTEAEWEFAARGPDGLVFPWGDTFLGNRLNICDSNCDQGSWADSSINDGYDTPAPVGNYANGASWVGAYDMAGNVWEWTRSIYNTSRYPYPYDADDGRNDLTDRNSQRVLRGSSWNWIAADARTTSRSPHATNYSSSDWYGFRCVRPFSTDDMR